MLNANNEQKVLLSKYIPDYEKFEEINDLLLELDDVMLESLDENDEGTDETTVIARLYDEIFVQN